MAYNKIMKIAVLGHGLEGNAIESYFKDHLLDDQPNQFTFFDHFTDSEIPRFELEKYDLVFRSPSVRPQFALKPEDRGKSKDWTSITNYFFEHCKAPIIGVTGTKGKGTTCSIITNILRQFTERFRKIHLVGNIGTPAILELDDIEENDLVVYEMSSFQCWDLKKSPHISVILRIEPDHLDRHLNFDDYVAAKGNIIKHQTAEDYCIYYANNAVSTKLGEQAPGKKSTYPILSYQTELKTLLDFLSIPGEHNRENAEAAILAVLDILGFTLDELFASQDSELYLKIKQGLSTFEGLPHRIQFVRELNHVRYYDDNYSSAFPASDVAIRTFEDYPTILIAGGKDRHLDLTEMKKRFFTAKNLKKIILIGETRFMLSEGEDPEKFILCDTLDEAVNLARQLAEKYAADLDSNYDLCIPSTNEARVNQSAKPAIVLMSPGAASFDMFKNFSDRGEQFQQLVNAI